LLNAQVSHDFLRNRAMLSATFGHALIRKAMPR